MNVLYINSKQCWMQYLNSALQTIDLCITRAQSESLALVKGFMSRWIFTLFAVVVWALLLSRPEGFLRIFFEYVMRFTGSKKRLGEAEGESHTHTHTHTHTHIRHGGSSTDGGNIRLSLSNSNSHAVSFHYCSQALSPKGYWFKS